MSAIVSNIDVAGFEGEGLDIIGTEDADFLLGTNDSELIDGLGGDDGISASDGDDLLFGGQGNDTIGGGAQNDSILGGAGADLIFAYDGDDLVDAGFGNDIIYSGEGADTLFGGEGQDSFVFDLEDFQNDPSVHTIADFELGDDSVIILGSDEDDSFALDSATGSISVNDEEIIVFEGGDAADDFELL